MICENQEYIETSWNAKNVDYYLSKGYEFTGYYKKFKVKFNDLIKNSNAKIRVKCDYCGKEFYITYMQYTKMPDSDKSIACQQCSGIKVASKTLKKRQDNAYEVVIDFCKRHGYKLITKKDDLINNQSYVEYICPIHGVVSTRLTNIKQDKICYDCSRKMALINKNKTTLPERQRKHYERILSAAKENGYELLSNPSDIKRNTDYIQYKCHIHGVHTMRVANFISGKGCPQCKNIESKGEKEVKRILKKLGVSFVSEKTFEGCRDKNKLPFDFYLPEYNICIEYDGEQHFSNVEYFNNSLEYVQLHDAIKSKYCKDNNIILLRIPYWDYSNIEAIITNELNLHKDIV